MIIGIGTDIVRIDRIQKVLARFDQRFLDRVFSPIEQAKAKASHNPAKTLASRFAAKEAAAKSLGLAIRQGIRFEDFSVENDPVGKPLLQITGQAATHLKTLIPPAHTVKIDISLAEEEEYALAFVVISVVAS